MLFYIKYSVLDTFHMIRRETEIMAKKFNGLERDRERGEGGMRDKGERERERESP